MFFQAILAALLASTISAAFVPTSEGSWRTHDVPYYQAERNIAFSELNNASESSKLRLFRRSGDVSPGLGIEFECQALKFQNKRVKKWTPQETKEIKGKQIEIGNMGVASRMFWDLTAEHLGDNDASRITTEFVIDGRRAKLGTESPETNAGDIAKFFMDEWRPSPSLSPPSNRIYVKEFEKDGSWELYDAYSQMSNYVFSLQATAPLPLSGIWQLFLVARGEERARNPLLTNFRRTRDSLLVVRQEHLAPWRPPGENSWQVSSDLLGFLSLVVSYAKGATRMNAASSPKMMTSIMPRTDFTAMYKMVEPEITAILHTVPCLSFADLIRFLCIFRLGEYWEERDSGTFWDIKRYSTGAQIETAAPDLQQDQVFSSWEYAFRAEADGYDDCEDRLLIKNWLDAMPNTDELRAFDHRWNDGQVGALGARTEGTLGRLNEQIPIFEFRDLDSNDARFFQERVKLIRTKIEQLHKLAPRRRRVFSRAVRPRPNPSSKACPVRCPKGQAAVGKNGKCEKCKQGYEPSQDQKKCIKKCAQDEARTGKSGQCVKCREGSVPSADQKSCQKKCPPGQAGSGPNGKCQKCKPGEEASMDNRSCVKKCPEGEARDSTGKCRPKTSHATSHATESERHSRTASHKSEPTEYHKTRTSETERSSRTHSHKSEATEYHRSTTRHSYRPTPTETYRSKVTRPPRTAETESHRPTRTESHMPRHSVRIIQPHLPTPNRPEPVSPEPEPEPAPPTPPRKPPPGGQNQQPLNPKGPSNGGRGGGNSGGHGGHGGHGGGGGGGHHGSGSPFGEGEQCPQC